MSVAVYVANTFVFAACRLIGFVARHVVVPLVRWYCRKLRDGWAEMQGRRSEARGSKQLRPSRRQRRRINRAMASSATMPDPELIYRALWWSLYVMAKEIPATTVANHMAHTKPDFHEAVAYVAGQIYTMPVRYPTEIEAMVWATELKALHGTEHRLPEVEQW